MDSRAFASWLRLDFEACRLLHSRTLTLGDLAVMNLAFFFEGTGIDGESDITNVTRLHNICVLNEAQMLHLEGGPGNALTIWLLKYDFVWYNLTKLKKGRLTSRC